MRMNAFSTEQTNTILLCTSKTYSLHIMQLVELLVAYFIIFAEKNRFFITTSHWSFLVPWSTSLAWYAKGQREWTWRQFRSE